MLMLEEVQKPPRGGITEVDKGGMQVRIEQW